MQNQEIVAFQNKTIRHIEHNGLKSIETRKDLTNEWQARGVKEGQEYAILTSEIAKADRKSTRLNSSHG